MARNFVIASIANFAAYAATPTAAPTAKGVV